MASCSGTSHLSVCLRLMLTELYAKSKHYRDLDDTTPGKITYNVDSSILLFNFSCTATAIYFFNGTCVTVFI